MNVIKSAGLSNAFPKSSACCRKILQSHFRILPRKNNSVRTSFQGAHGCCVGVLRRGFPALFTRWDIDIDPGKDPAFSGDSGSSHDSGCASGSRCSGDSGCTRCSSRPRDPGRRRKPSPRNPGLSPLRLPQDIVGPTNPPPPDLLSAPHWNSSKDDCSSS